MSSRLRAILLIGGACVILMLLAAGMSTLELKPGQVFDIQQARPLAGAPPTASNTDLWIVFLRGMMLFIAILFPVYVVYMLIDAQRRKRLLAELFGLAVFMFMMVQLQNYLASRPEQETPIVQVPTPQAMEAQGGASSGGQTPVYDEQPSDLVVTIVAAMIGIILAGAVILTFWYVIQKTKIPHQVLVEVAAKAEETLEAILAGKDLRETILVCYRRMVEIAVKDRGIPRDAAITPHEFETILIAKGLPAHAVKDLTHLFEEVRYGDLAAGEEDRRRATLALRTVIAACRQEAQAA